MSIEITELAAGNALEVRATGRLTTAKIKYFDHTDLAKAREWLAA